MTRSRRLPDLPSSLGAARLTPTGTRAEPTSQYLLVMTPRIAGLIEEIHRPGADIAAVFAAHDSEIVEG